MSTVDLGTTFSQGKECDKHTREFRKGILRVRKRRQFSSPRLIDIYTNTVRMKTALLCAQPLCDSHSVHVFVSEGCS